MDVWVRVDRGAAWSYWQQTRKAKNKPVSHWLHRQQASGWQSWINNYRRSRELVARSAEQIGTRSDRIALGCWTQPGW
ncbi:MAG: hypothetical protein M0T77_15305 [Actinomycetota bacterium]|nr:hypothetical protein [Actinomycetota bacterium]